MPPKKRQNNNKLAPLPLKVPMKAWSKPVTPPESTAPPSSSSAPTAQDLPPPGLIPSSLLAYWPTLSSRRNRICVFYGEKNPRFSSFSNFHPHPFSFVVPVGTNAGESHPVPCSEHAIMLSKASLFSDPVAFSQILAAPTPKDAKDLGRTVQNFEEQVWQENVVDIAISVIRQKFNSSKTLRDILTSTGIALIAEAAPMDVVWGVGLGAKSNLICDPKNWRGANVLGHALMVVREELNGDQV